MFEHDRSAARGQMATRGLYVFERDSELGYAHTHSLFDRIAVARKAGTETTRSFGDCTVTIDETSVPSGVKLLRSWVDLRRRVAPAPRGPLNAPANTAVLCFDAPPQSP
jgi:hypothetical protein